jgi:hypothetical protein
MSSRESILPNLAVAAAALVIALGVVLAIIFGARLMQDRSASPSVSIQASWLVNAGQQIEAAQQMYQAMNSGRLATSTAALVDQGALSVMPAPPAGVARGQWKMSPDGRISFIELEAGSSDEGISIADAVCARILQVSGGEMFRISGGEPVAEDLLEARALHGCGKKGSETLRRMWYIHKN